ncbi:hypothetical protein B0H14DRAFT_2820524 [Mycena olivaceomarginata]|nr:hypothetical protein B0H14DRAFT_2820524 [Mycena olivaceomarginata]
MAKPWQRFVSPQPISNMPHPSLNQRCAVCERATSLWCSRCQNTCFALCDSHLSMANSKSTRMCPISRKWRGHRQQSRLGVGPTPGIVAESPNQEREFDSEIDHSQGKIPDNVSSTRNNPLPPILDIESAPTLVVAQNAVSAYPCKKCSRATTDKKSTPSGGRMSAFKKFILSFKIIVIVQHFHGEGRGLHTESRTFGDSNICGGTGGKGGSGVDGGPGGTGEGPVLNSNSPHLTLSF